MTHEEARAQFPVFERWAYMNAGTMGPLARATLTAMDERLRHDQELGRGGGAWFASVIDLREQVRGQLAALLGTAPERIALTFSTTDGCNIVLAGLGLTGDDEVVTTDAEHPGLLAPLGASAARIRVAEVTKRPAADALEVLLAQVTPGTRLIAISNVLWTTGQVMPVHEVKAETGLPVLVDGAQSVGAIPVDVGELDFYTVSCQKWPCGPDPTGALYVRDPDALRVALPTSWSHLEIEPDGAFEPRNGAKRFDSGWIAAPTLAGLSAALDAAPEWRYERAAEMVARCRAALAERFEVVTEPGQAGLISFRGPGEALEDARRAYEAGVIIRDLGETGWLRASCGWWTNEDDVERLVSALS
jgi:selenocysteine lyase/cysteine desulfurase